MIAAPEMVRMTEEFRNVKERRTEEHREMGWEFQKKFQTNTKNFVNTLIELGNPLESMYGSLGSIGSRRIPHSRAISSFRSLEIVGKSQYDTFHYILLLFNCYCVL